MAMLTPIPTGNGCIKPFGSLMVQGPSTSNLEEKVSKLLLFLVVSAKVPTRKNPARKVEEQPGSDSQSGDCKSNGFGLGGGGLFPSAFGSSLRNVRDETFGTASQSLPDVTRYNACCANFDVKSLRNPRQNCETVSHQRGKRTIQRSISFSMSSVH
jgi:hypothetical protein